MNGKTLVFKNVLPCSMEDRCMFTKVYSVITWKTIILIFTLVRTSKLVSAE
jgi:hypothetical protein